VLLMAILMQISANTGPAECCLGVVRMLAYLDAQARLRGLELALVEEVAGPVKGTLQSAFVSLEGEAGACRDFAEVYAGPVLWVCSSPYRPHHPRKNWYLDVAVFAEPPGAFGDEVVFETMRSSGPGGQHANKTETAVRATHVATGISVRIGGSRSQSANKATALALLGSKVEAYLAQGRDRQRSERWVRHRSRPAGGAVQRFTGPEFTPEARSRTPAAPPPA
jgi:peptide chain release factor